MVPLIVPLITITPPEPDFAAHEKFAVAPLDTKLALEVRITWKRRNDGIFKKP